jgi:hypothetical protein
MKTPSPRFLFAALPAIAIALGALNPAVAELLVYEGFDIPPGEIHDQAGATSFGWRVVDAAEVNWSALSGEDLYHGVADAGIAYPGLAGVGNAFEFRDEAVQGSNAAHRFLPNTPFPYFFGYYFTSGQYWISATFTAKIEGDPAGSGWFQFTLSDPIAMHNSIYMGISNNATRDQTVWSAGGERLKIDDVQGEKWSLSDVPVEDGVPVFLVMKLDFDNKTAAWWANPPLGVDDPGEPVDAFTMWTDLIVDRVMLRVVNNGPSQLQDVPDFEGQGLGADYTGSRVDEIRIGTTYASVAPLAPPPPVQPRPVIVVGAGAAEVGFVRAVGDTSWVPELSDDLSGWQSPSAFGVTVSEQAVDNGDGTETVTLSIDNVPERMFLRMAQD